jgi:thiamine biosynthesis lipoprotein
LDVSLIDFDQETGRVSFGKEGMAVDFGGIAKGYTSARIMDIFAECGVTSAMVNLGGNVQTYGTKPDGKKWKIAVQDPKKEGNYLCIIDSAGQAIITSGGYERYFEEDGVRYHHIIDPSDGYPADNGLVSVTIVSADGTLADGLSTSLFVMGRDKAIDYWREHSGEFEMVLYTDGGELLATEGLKDILTSEYAVTYIGST